MTLIDNTPKFIDEWRWLLDGSQLSLTNYQLPIPKKMTVQNLIDLLMSVGDKDLKVLIQPSSNSGRHGIECVDIDDSGEAILYMEEIALDNINH